MTSTDYCIICGLSLDGYDGGCPEKILQRFNIDRKRFGCLCGDCYRKSVEGDNEILYKKIIELGEAVASLIPKDCYKIVKPQFRVLLEQYHYVEE